MSKPPIAYVVQTFPALTQTFIYRETLALERRGFDIITCGIWKPDRARLSQESQHLVDSSYYVFPTSPLKFLKAHICCLSTHPVRYVSTLLFVLTRRGESAKNRFRTLFHFLEAVCLVPAMERRQVEHVHAHFTINAATIALVLSRLLDISFSFTAHNIFFTDAILLRDKIQEARFIVAISEFSKQFLTRLVPGKHVEDKIHVVHCGLPPEDFAPPHPKLENAVPLILFVAQLADRKGAPVLVEACRILTKRGTPFRCTIIGGGQGRVLSVLQVVEQYGLQETVKLTGALPQERVREYLECADVFVLPCITTSDGDMDGIPVSLMEAMAMEIPTVSTYVSGIPELINNDHDGLLVDEKDEGALADALQRLLENRDLRERLGKNGRQKVIKEFNTHRNTDQLATLFEEHLGR